MSTTADEEDRAVVERVPEEGISGPVCFFHNERDLPWGCFSNFFRAPIVINMDFYQTNEHRFQEQKQCGPGGNKELRDKIRLAGTAGIAKELGMDRANPIRSDWDVVKEQCMMDAIVAKFCQHPLLLHALMQTKHTMLVEHSRHSGRHADRYWGDGGSHFDGKNRLGVLLMQFRELLRTMVEQTRIPTPPTEVTSVNKAPASFAFEARCELLDPVLDTIRRVIGRQYAATNKRAVSAGQWQATLLDYRSADHLTIMNRDSREE